MSYVAAYQTNYGQTVYVEVDDGAGMQKVAREPVRAERTLDQALEGVMPAAESLLGRVGRMSRKPTAVELELGIKFNVKSGAIIASTALEGNIKVKITWSAALERDANADQDAGE
jgi:hypothetical protein